ncbi:MAG: small multi-drug export protein [Clostridia bacterium]|nr:small multi-drug export protein [Clostridia bacterium]
MTEFIRNLIGSDLWATLIMSFVPLIELKGGIVFARGVGFDFLTALGLSYVGSTAVFFPIYFLLRPILELLKKIKWFNKIAVKVEEYFKGKADETMEKHVIEGDNKKSSDTFLKQLGVFIFVAIPLPMTGVWTGTAIAVFLNLKFKDAVLPVVLGNLVAGLIISALAALCLAVWTIEVLDYILYGLFALAIILLIFTVIKIAKKKPSKEEK